MSKDPQDKYGVQDSLAMDTGEGRRIGHHVYTVMGPSRPCSWFCKVSCFCGLHRWAFPGGYCECCGKEDTFFVDKTYEQGVQDEHKSHLDFENELYATLVDPVAEGSIKEAEMRAQLLGAARWYRQHCQDLKNQLNARNADRQRELHAHHDLYPPDEFVSVEWAKKFCSMLNIGDAWLQVVAYWFTKAHLHGQVQASGIVPTPPVLVGVQFPKICDLCEKIIESQNDLDWHGLGNCMPICERCSGSGIDPNRDRFIPRKV